MCLVGAEMGWTRLVTLEREEKSLDGAVRWLEGFDSRRVIQGVVESSRQHPERARRPHHRRRRRHRKLRRANQPRQISRGYAEVPLQSEQA